MQYLKDTGYIIKRHNTSEADKYITILTQNNGRIEVLAKGVRKPSSRRSGSIELLNKISFQAVSKASSNRYVLADVTLLNNHTDLRQSLEHMKSLFLMCELLSTLCPYGEKHENVYNLLEKSLVDLKTEKHAFVMQSFQVKLLSNLGFWDPHRSFIDSDDITSFVESVMQKKIRSNSFFRA